MIVGVRKRRLRPLEKEEEGSCLFSQDHMKEQSISNLGLQDHKTEIKLKRDGYYE